MSRGVPSICACRQSSDKAARFDIKPLAASVFLHGAVVAALSVAISAGLLYSRGDALTDALEVELVLMPDVVPAVIEQKESLSGPHAKKAEEPPEIFSEADAVQTEPVSSRNAAQQAQPYRDTAKGGILPYTYRERLMRHIERYKYYPAVARRQGLEGQAIVAFQIDRQGAVGTVRVVKTSGHHLLDHAALVTLQRASPLPEPPETFSSQDLAFRLPVQYSLGK